MVSIISLVECLVLSVPTKKRIWFRVGDISLAIFSSCPNRLMLICSSSPDFFFLHFYFSPKFKLFTYRIDWTNKHTFWCVLCFSPIHLYYMRLFNLFNEFVQSSITSSEIFNWRTIHLP